jgi:hypothetical protein
LKHHPEANQDLEVNWNMSEKGKPWVALGYLRMMIGKMNSDGTIEPFQK